MAPGREAGLGRGWTSPAAAGGANPGSGVRGAGGGRCRLPRQRGGPWAKVQSWNVAAGKRAVGAVWGRLPRGQELQGDQPGLLRRLTQALGGDEGGAAG